MSTRVRQAFQSAAGAAGGGGLDVDEVFSTYLYTGNGSSQTITNGIDLSGEGGMVWVKNRDASATAAIVDTERGASYFISPSETAAQAYNTTANINALNSDGFTVGTGNYTRVNGSGYNYASWTFRKAPKFFDVVTYTGNGTQGRTVSHNLGSAPGFIVVKKTSSTGNWPVYHRGMTSALYGMQLNSVTDQFDADSYWDSTDPTDSVFTLGNNADVNQSGATYVAYLWAHNNSDGEFGPTSDQDIIKCGSYTGAGSSGVSIDLGFEPQWLLIKKTNGGAHWSLFDVMRGIPSPDNGPSIQPNTSAAESSGNEIDLTPTGFDIYDGSDQVNGNGDSYIYMAIRRGPMAVPESASDVFAIDTRGSQGSLPSWQSGFVTDLALNKATDSRGGTLKSYSYNRLRAGRQDEITNTAPDTSVSNRSFDYMTGYGDQTASEVYDYSWMWKRAPGYLDLVAYKGTGSLRTISHNLGVVPEMMWFKMKDGYGSWAVYHKAMGATHRVLLNTSAASVANPYLLNNTSPTDSVFTLGGAFNSNANTNGNIYLAYLFATLPGISKVGSYTGDGTSNSSKVIDCGFSSGARFVLIKAATGEANNWFMFDTVRGIVAGNDSVLKLDRPTAANSNVDYIDPHNSGFIVGAASNSVNAVNVSGVTYIFYAIA